jgi:hypothetical protein
LKVSVIDFASFMLLWRYSHKGLITVSAARWFGEVDLQSLELGEKQSVELCDTIGRMLVMELNTEAVRIKIRRLVAEYVNKRDIADEPERLLKKLEWSVRVKFGH